MAIASIANLTDSTVAGSNTEIQYNNSGVFGASSNLTFDGTTLQVGSGIATPNTNGDNLVLNSTGNVGLSILGDTTASASIIYFGIVGDESSGRIFYQNSVTPFMDFYTADTHQMRIDSSGMVRIGNTSGGGSHLLYVKASNAGDNIVRFDNSASTNPYGLRLDTSGASPDNNTVTFLNCVDSTTTRLYIYSDGDVANHDGAYGTISDVKFKQDIADVRSYWDDFKALRYRKFRHKSDVEVDANAPYRLGLIAQEVETIFPALVPESPDIDKSEEVAIVDENGDAVLDDQGNPTFETVTTPSGTTHKWVKSSIIEGPIMASVVQELMARVEALQAQVAALQGA